MAWDYSELSKEAKKFGGPENYVKQLVEISKTKGREEMYPLIVFAVVGASAVTTAVIKLGDYYEKKRVMILDAVKEKLIREMEKYDEVYQEGTDIEKGQNNE